jgi:hypothetical protein
MKPIFNSSLYTLHEKLTGNYTGPGPEVEWFGYGGGPKSQFGLGRTKHKRWVDTTNDITGSKGRKKYWGCFSTRRIIHPNKTPYFNNSIK